MDDIRFKNLWDAFTSDLDYCNFLESYGTDDISFKNTNFDLLKIIYGGFILTLLIDNYFIKKDNQIKSEIFPDIVRQLVEKIAVKNTKGYSIGSLHYHDEYTLLNTIRNKLAHGDFIVRNGKIVIVENKTEGIIDIDNFVRFLSSFEASCERNTINKPYTKAFYMPQIRNIINYVKSENDIDIMCSNIYEIKFTDYPIGPANRNADYIYLREQFYEEVKKIINNGTINDIEKLFERNVDVFKSFNMNIEYEITTIKKLKYYDKIRKRYLQKQKENKNASLLQQVNFINNLAYSLGKNQQIKLIKGTLLNMIILETLKNYPNANLIDVINMTPEVSNLYYYHFDDTILSSYLVGFNSMYQYGLEKGLTVQGSYNLVNIYDGKSLDFSKLLIDELLDPNMLIEHTFSKYTNDVDEYENKELNKIADIIKRLEEKLNNYIINCKNKDESKIEQFKNEIDEKKQEKEKLLERIKCLKEFLNQFDLNKYTKNFNIIVHIRNAIAHGNVYLEDVSDNILDSIVKFEDYKDGNIVYEKRVKISDFLMLFGSVNIIQVFNYITNNIQDKSLINSNYIYELDFRIRMRMLDNEFNFKTKVR